VKKTLLGALLVVSMEFASCLCNQAEFPFRTSDFIGVLSCPIGSTLFWHAWDVILDRVFVAAAGNSKGQRKNNSSAVSIPLCFVRRLDSSSFVVEPGIFPRLVTIPQKES
jgi:hypothetical protein